MRYRAISMRTAGTSDNATGDNDNKTELAWELSLLQPLGCQYTTYTPLVMGPWSKDIVLQPGCLRALYSFL